MDYIELSIEDVKEKSIDLAKNIKEDYIPDVVIFIAKGAYPIGYEISNFFSVPLLEIFAKRKVGKMKKYIVPFLKWIPKKIKKTLRKKEVTMNVHEKNTQRDICFDETKWKKYKNAEKILIVDDSSDTGNTIMQVKKCVEQYFMDASVKIATFNIFLKSQELVKIDYHIYENTMICGPWSNDSKYYKEFLSNYTKWKSETNEY